MGNQTGLKGENTMKKALIWGAALFALFVLAGCPKDPDPPEPFTLTVTGIPSSIPIMGASLLKENDIDNSFATGVNSSGTITFYHPDKDGRLPDYAKPFHTAGEYLIALAEVDMATFRETAVYFYTKNNEREKVSFPTSASLAWSDFVKKED